MRTLERGRDAHLLQFVPGNFQVQKKEGEGGEKPCRFKFQKPLQPAACAGAHSGEDGLIGRFLVGTLGNLLQWRRRVQMQVRLAQ